MSGDSRLAVTANDDCTLKIYSLQGKNIAVFFRDRSPVLKVQCVRFHSVIHIFIKWLQWCARSDWLYSCNDRALLARCPRHMQSVFDLMVDILMNIYVISRAQGYNHDFFGRYFIYDSYSVPRYRFF